MHKHHKVPRPRSVYHYLLFFTLVSSLYLSLYLSTTPSSAQSSNPPPAPTPQASTAQLSEGRTFSLFLPQIIQNSAQTVRSASGSASLGDLVWVDSNGNGVKDTGEPGLSGVQIKLFTDCNGNTLIGTTTSNVNGNYYFNNLEAGEYYLRVYPPTGYDFTLMDAIADDDYDSDIDEGGFSWCLNVNPGAVTTNVDIGLVTTGVPTATATPTPAVTASLGDLAWIDTNGNGVKDIGEPGLAGVQIKLFTDCSGNTLVGTTTTNVNGNYGFTGLTAGEYYLRVYPPTGYDFTLMDAIADDDYDSDIDEGGFSWCLNVDPGAAITNVDIGLITTGAPTATATPTATPLPASLGDLVWVDSNSNGVKDIGEPGLSGVQIKLFTDCNGNTLVGTTASNVNGNYYFNNLAAGEYYLRVYPPTGYDFTLMDAIADDDYDSDIDVNGFSWCLNVAAGSQIINVDIGLIQLGGATATATPTNTPVPTNTPIPTATPTYTSVPTPTASNTPVPTATPSPVGNASLGDLVWVDSNGNGVKDTGEPGLSGVQIKLFTDCNGNTLVGTTTSNVNGNYYFTNLVAGEYYLRVYPPTGYDFTLMDAIADDDYDSDIDANGFSWCLEIAAGSQIINVDIGLVQLGAATATATVSNTSTPTNTPVPTATPTDTPVPTPTATATDTAVPTATSTNTPAPTFTPTETPVPTATSTPAGTASLGDLVWVDSNGNGVKDTGEPGLSGVQIKLFTDCVGNTLVGTTTSNVNGNYYFTNLSAGEYYLRVYPPTGYDFTLMDAIADDDYDSDIDVNGFSWCLEITAGSQIINVDIGLVQLGAATVTATNTSLPTNTPANTPEPTATATNTSPAPATATPTDTATPYPSPTATAESTTTPSALTVPLVFVSRQIPDHGSVYWLETKGMPGVGPYSRFQVASPGKLLIREPNGTIRPLIDGSNPTAASLNLIDVNAPAVSYDGTQILFAGIPQGSYSRAAMTNPGAWRIYAINVDGSGLRQITTSDRDTLDLSQFGQIVGLFTKYDDTDPAWLPDGRIVFSSTRWPAMAMYGGAHTSNLFVVNADGSDLHRITTEANGADRPAIDPTTGRIVYARWWRNMRMAANNMGTVAAPGGGYLLKDGLVSADASGELGDVPGESANLQRNAWHLATVKPDGSDLKQWGFTSSTFLLGEDANFAYGGSFAADGSFYGNFFPIKNGTEAAGFGGIRHFYGGMFGSQSPVIGITSEVGYQYVKTSDPVSIGIYQGVYAAEPEVISANQLVISYVENVNQDYGLYLINSDGSGLQLLYDLPGTTELRARLVAPRPLPPIIADQITQRANPLPPTAAGPYDRDGSFTFDALNVYFNAPVDSNIISAIPVGSAGTIRFFTGFQRNEQYGSLEQLEWPLLLQEVPVNPNGSVSVQSPANVPLFEQIRTGDGNYTVPLTGRAHTELGGAAHVAGLNFGHPGETQRCVGCHAGHSMIPVPANPADALFSNVAPSAAISYSSIFALINPSGEGLVDRKVQKGKITNYWRSAANQNPNGQWVQLAFPVPVTVRTVRLYNPRFGDVAQSTLQVEAATVILYSDTAATQEVARQSVGQLAVSGTDVSFGDVRAKAVRVVVDNVSGSFEGLSVASLAEVEVIARVEAAE